MLDDTNRSWITNQLEGNTLPPFSLQYDGQRLTDLLLLWTKTEQVQLIDENRTSYIFGYFDEKTMIRIIYEGIYYAQEDAMEWVLNIKNEGEEDSGIFENLFVFDNVVFENLSANYVVHRNMGSNAQKNDFQPITEELVDNDSVEMYPMMGRSSNTTAFPFFNLEAPGIGGVIIAIGWSGQWISLIQRKGDSLSLQTGLDDVHLRLHPGEQIRIPRILFFPWKSADFIDGHNQFRQFMLHYYTPHLDGSPIQLPLSCSGCRGQKLGDEANNFTVENQLEYAAECAKFETEYMWIDAGWFEGRWPDGVGNWFVRKDGFPDGLRPLTDAFKEMGMKFVLWFEPERVHVGTWLDVNHPEWILRLPNSRNNILNLGNPEAREWLTDHISNMISTEGIDVYRQDFNIEPMAFWEKADTPDREGMTEIRYIEGLYTFWDELRLRHPNLIIDNCASGGRRIDLETVSRSVALWRSDYRYFEPNGQQCHTYGLSFYLPTTSTGTDEPNQYKFRSAMNNGLGFGWKYFEPEFDPVMGHQCIAEFKRIRQLYFGDYYPLTPYSLADDVWMAFQFQRTDLHEGMVLVFRRADAENTNLILQLKGIIPETEYSVEFLDARYSESTTGEQLKRGIEVTIDTAPGSRLILYHW